MSKYIYSPSHNAFYLTALKAEYELSDNWPEDGMEISDDLFIQYTSTPPDGKERGVDSDGMPCWVDLPEPTTEELIAAAESKRQQLINEANTCINNKQWPGKAAIGRLKGEELSQYNLWLDYLDALEAVDTSSAPDINWPVPPEQ
ncbi:tail fiber assembly protein [Citrobacter koseri]|uniref:Tail fiber assembly protein n=1 Tax=Citrobacter koseri TaxID=545 RepID=A0AAQ0V9U9_CITKO|nr:tail fiber assembly protein [Citrobacter koseri]EJK7984194.1 tail fiber assembly protein [Citrobacter koseri]MDU3230065.1 tail fiber assembly protein [Citrobacter koseri]RSC18802.1 tail fiber assembly protein [Citrobacter koseri]HAT3696911.1 tail fiber assembly protein [Citrobacter koseri]